MTTRHALRQKQQMKVGPVNDREMRIDPEKGARRG